MPSIKLLSYIFLTYLLVAFASRPCFYSTARLTIGLNIGKAESIGQCYFLLMNFSVDLLEILGLHDLLIFYKQSKALFIFLLNDLSILDHNQLWVS